MRAVVVGGQGFIGSEIVYELLRRGDQVSVVDRRAARPACNVLFGDGAVEAIAADILDRESLLKAFRGADEVYHLAGKVGTTELDGAIDEAVTVNIIGAINVFEASLRAGVPRVFYPSKPNVWLNTYTITKHASERFAELYAAYAPIEICSLRYFNAYGPRQSLYPIRKIIPAFAAQALRGIPLVVFGDGEQTVDMVYSEDLARITVEFVRSGYAGAPIDCGRGIALTVNEVAAAVNDFFGNPAGVAHAAMRRGETAGTRLVADAAPLQNVLGSLDFTPWEASLGLTLEWYAAQDSGEIDAALSCLGLTA